MADSYDETADMKALQRQVAEALASWNAFLKIKPGSAAATAALELCLAKMPDPQQLGLALKDLTSQVAALSTRIRDSREARFKSVEATFVRAKRERNEPFSETNDGWRVGRFELVVDRVQSRIQVRYNREVVVPWTPVRSVDDLELVLTRARRELDRAEVKGERLQQVLWHAYQDASRAARSSRVPLNRFYKEFRVALVRSELDGSKTDKKLAWADFPKWAFLYNLDLYRARIGSVPREFRLDFETGAQRDHGTSMAMLLGGLDPTRPTQSYCYVVSATGGRS